MTTDADDLRRALEHMPVSSPSRRLRALLPVIDQRIRDGVSHIAIVEALASHGIAMSLETFRKRLYRWRKAQDQDRGSSSRTIPSSSPGRTPLPPPGHSIRNKSDLIAMRSAEIDLDELARLGKNKE